ncbi:MAG: cysteine-rich small domain-containing protein [Bacillota bacterium]
MRENFKFVQNNKCEYFPCHKVNDTEHYNCLFCYCPLYMLKDKCGGNFTYTHDVKDCSACTIPHSKGAYDYIMSKMDEVIRIGSERE